MAVRDPGLMWFFSDSTASRGAPPAETLETAPGPMPAYRARRAAGLLKPDPAQELAVEKLQMMHRALLNYKPHPVTSGGWRARLGLLAPQDARERRPRGLYVYGGVGRGKSMLMDLFFETSAVQKKRRVHFFAFMQEVHNRLHRMRETLTGDPLPVVARDIAADAWLLCFDEFQVTDIADAMILGRLFEALFTEGVVVVATSNRAPDELYKDGLQRERFLPFIDILKQELDLLELDNGRDYRLSRLAGRRVYYFSLGPEATRHMDEIFAELTDDIRPEQMVIEINTRRLTVPRQAMGVARFTFKELCGQPLWAAEYLAIAERFETVLIDDVPKLGPELSNEAKRFNTLIDALYEAKVRLVVSAEVPPEELYTDGDGAFEFERTVSRLMEMQSLDYISARRRTLPSHSDRPAELVVHAVSR
jgi:cell division protein ZapE